MHGVLALTAGLLTACAGGPRQLRDEGSERIEEAMRPEPHPEVIPEGIVLGDDAPPLAPEGPEGDTDSVLVASGYRHARRRWAHGRTGFGSGAVYGGPLLYPVRYHIKATPGGTTPGLLP